MTYSFTERCSLSSANILGMAFMVVAVNRQRSDRAGQEAGPDSIGVAPAIAQEPRGEQSREGHGEEYADSLHTRAHEVERQN